MTLKCAKTETT